MAEFTKPKRASKGPVGTKKLFESHAKCIEELQAQAKKSPGESEIFLKGEDTRFLGVKDNDIVAWSIMALLEEVEIE